MGCYECSAAVYTNGYNLQIYIQLKVKCRVRTVWITAVYSCILQYLQADKHGIQLIHYILYNCVN